MSASERDVHDLAAAYALDALPPDEARFFEAHLELCEACRDEVDELRATAAKLGAATAKPAPASLRDTVLTRIDTVRQAPPPARRPERPGTWARIRGPLAGAAAAALIVVVGLTAAVARLNSRIDDLRARNAQIYEVLAAEDVRTVTVEGEGGLLARLVVSDSEGRAMVIAQGLQPLGADRVYEAWLIDDSGAQPAGLFRPDDEGRAVHVLVGRVHDRVRIGITIEPAGGSLQPTSDPILLADI
ncbi:MAG: anti-sigma factor [Nitriliruptorales bacterium]